MSTPNGSEAVMKKDRPPGSDIESAEAAFEFAALIKMETAKRREERRDDKYEVRPCTRVRGYTLKLPVLGWRLWYPTANAAAKFAQRVAKSYRADFCVYDAAGQPDPQFAQN